MPAEMTPRIPPPSMASATRRPSPYGRPRGPARAASTCSTSCAGATLGGQAVQCGGQLIVVDDGEAVGGAGDGDVEVVPAHRRLGEYPGRIDQHDPGEFKSLGLVD